MPVGDSITFGCGDSCADLNTYNCLTNATFDCPNPLGPRTCHSGYRASLQNMLQGTAGISMEYVGPLDNGPWLNLKHAGYGEAVIGPCSSSNPACTMSLDGQFAKWTDASFRPDLLLMQIGTEDFLTFNRSADEALNDVGNLLFRIRKEGFGVQQGLPSPRILLASLPAIPRYVAADQQRVAFNAKLPQLIQSIVQSTGLDVRFVDVARRTGLCPQWPNQMCCLAFDAHPSDQGYLTLANFWYSEITAIYPPG
jgi:hypothetical protein